LREVGTEHTGTLLASYLILVWRVCPHLCKNNITNVSRQTHETSIHTAKTHQKRLAKTTQNSALIGCFMPFAVTVASKNLANSAEVCYTISGKYILLFLKYDS
jgi:hypothetical protein